MFCPERPTIYGRPLADSPPPTQVPLSIQQAGPSQWTYDAMSGLYDDKYFAQCGSSQATKRFDSDTPRLYLGPVPNHPPHRFPIFDVEGTDCPDGTDAVVTIAVGGRPTTYTATIDEYGDWSVELPVPFGSEPMTVVAAERSAIHR
ncbi:MAG: hypothetical protein WKF43_09340 [Acidimicrobiales bacterium]